MIFSSQKVLFSNIEEDTFVYLCTIEKKKIDRLIMKTKTTWIQSCNSWSIFNHQNAWSCPQTLMESLANITNRRLQQMLMLLRILRRSHFFFLAKHHPKNNGATGGGIMVWFVPFLLPWDKQQLESSSVFRADYSIRLYQRLWNKIEWINPEMKALCLWAALQFGLGQKNGCWWCGHHFTAPSSRLSNEHHHFCRKNQIMLQMGFGAHTGSEMGS